MSRPATETAEKHGSPAQAKCGLNKAVLDRHGVSLSLAVQLDWSTAVTRVDERHNYGEERFVSLAPLDGRLYTVVFVLCEGKRRIISLRKSNNREINFYESQD